MTTLPIIALMSDFGLQDGFTGILKGVIYRTLAQKSGLPFPTYPPIADITHAIEPFNVWHGAWVLQNSHIEFPEQTIFVCIIDPAVGQPQQRQILLHWPERRQFFIGPDNGLFTPLLQTPNQTFQAWHIQNPCLFRKANGLPAPVSRTFHGRDIYAPTAAHLAGAMIELSPKALEMFLESVGEPVPIENLHRLNWPIPGSVDKEIFGHVMHIDQFGNLITNIPGDWLEPIADQWSLEVLQYKWLCRAGRSYADGEDSTELLIIPASTGTLEIALCQQSAQEELHLVPGDPITLRPASF